MKNEMQLVLTRHFEYVVELLLDFRSTFLLRRKQLFVGCNASNGLKERFDPEIMTNRLLPIVAYLNLAKDRESKRRKKVRSL